MTENCNKKLIKLYDRRHHQTLVDGLWKFYRKQHDTDMSFMGYGQSIHAHQIVLEVFLSTDKLVEIEWGANSALPHLLEFLYKGQVMVPEDELDVLLTVAAQLEIGMLVDAVDVARGKNVDQSDKEPVSIPVLDLETMLEEQCQREYQDKSDLRSSNSTFQSDPEQLRQFDAVLSEPTLDEQPNVEVLNVCDSDSGDDRGGGNIDYGFDEDNFDEPTTEKFPQTTKIIREVESAHGQKFPVKTVNPTNRHQCHICPNWYSTRHGLIIHVRVHRGEKPLACNLIRPRSSVLSERTQKNFVTKRGEATDQPPPSKDSNPPNSVDNAKPYKCEECGVAFDFRFCLVNHAKRHSSKKRKNGGALVPPYKSNEKNTKPDKESIISTTPRAIDSLPQKEISNKSNECGESIAPPLNQDSNASRGSEVNAISNPFKSKKPIKVDQPKTTLPSGVLTRNRFMKNRREVDAHPALSKLNESVEKPSQRMSSDEDQSYDPVKEVSNNSFAESGSDTSRKKWIRKDGPPFTTTRNCSICKETLATPKHLWDHYKTHINTNGYHQCPLCPNDYTQRHTLIEHVITHSNERPFKCDLCPSSFVRRQAMLIHQRTHAIKHDKPFRCTVCSRSYRRKVNLRTHARVHATDEESYSCDVCNRKFLTPFGRRRHRLTHLLEDNREFEHKSEKSSLLSKSNEKKTNPAKERITSTPPQASECSPQKEKSNKNNECVRVHSTRIGSEVDVILAHSKSETPIEADKPNVTLPSGILTRNRLIKSRREVVAQPAPPKVSDRNEFAVEEPSQRLSSDEDESFDLKDVSDSESNSDDSFAGETPANKSGGDKKKPRKKRIRKDRRCSSKIRNCGICKATVNSYKKLRDHYKTHINTNGHHQCPFCPREYTLRHTLIYHVSATHSDERAFKCDLCPSSFVRRQAMLIHQRAHANKPDKPFRCTVCSRSFLRKVNLRAHARVHVTDEEAHSCDVCNRKFLTPFGLKRHSLWHLSADNKKFGCKWCNKKFWNRNTLITHTRLHREERQHKCGECDGSFISTKSLDMHVSRVHRGMKLHSCDKCDRQFLKKDMMEFHRLVHTNCEKFKCSVCDETFDHLSKLRCHSSSHAEKKLFDCDQCDRKFRSHRYLQLHLEKHLGVTFKCPLCHKSFTSKRGLKIHAMKHNGEKPFECERCNKRFSFKSGRDIHLARHDKPLEKSFICDVCGKGFYFKGSLDTHVLRHADPKPHICHVCGKGFSAKSTLDLHAAVHVSKRQAKKQYDCNRCGQSFEKRATLDIHLRAHSGLETYKCDGCAMTFAGRSQLEVHARTHTGEKLFPCDICPKKFSQNFSLKRHVAVCHSTVKKNFKCDLCFLTYAQLDYLKTHKFLKHGQVNNENSVPVISISTEIP